MNRRGFLTAVAAIVPAAVVAKETYVKPLTKTQARARFGEVVFTAKDILRNSLRIAEYPDRAICEFSIIATIRTDAPALGDRICVNLREFGIWFTGRVESVSWDGLRAHVSAAR